MLDIFRLMFLVDKRMTNHFPLQWLKGAYSSSGFGAQQSCLVAYNYLYPQLQGIGSDALSQPLWAPSQTWYTET